MSTVTATASLLLHVVTDLVALVVLLPILIGFDAKHVVRYSCCIRSPRYRLLAPTEP